MSPHLLLDLLGMGCLSLLLTVFSTFDRNVNLSDLTLPTLCHLP